MTAAVSTVPASDRRRLRPGTHRSDMYRHTQLVASPGCPSTMFALYERLESHAHSPSRAAMFATSLEAAASFVSLPEGEDQNLWIYDLFRFFCSQLNVYLARLAPHCTANSCPVMKATDEWVFLCAAHKGNSECSAPAYMIHTLDSIVSFLSSSRNFPSRVSIPKASVKQYSSLARRLYRLFAHAYYHHRETFEELEAETGLCAKFTAFAQTFKLVADDLLIVPVNALG
eukprot:ANDGO_03125.mRNA.1 MOB kinase activator-like 4